MKSRKSIKPRKKMARKTGRIPATKRAEKRRYKHRPSRKARRIGSGFAHLRIGRRVRTVRGTRTQIGKVPHIKVRVFNRGGIGGGTAYPVKKITKLRAMRAKARPIRKNPAPRFYIAIDVKGKREFYSHKTAHSISTASKAKASAFRSVELAKRTAATIANLIRMPVAVVD